MLRNMSLSHHEYNIFNCFKFLINFNLCPTLFISHNINLLSSSFNKVSILKCAIYGMVSSNPIEVNQFIISILVQFLGDLCKKFILSISINCL